MSARAVPVTVALQVAAVIGKRVGRLSGKERQRLIGLLRGSRGRPGNLSAKERQEVGKLVGKLDLKSAPGEVLPLLRGGRGRKRR